MPTPPLLVQYDADTCFVGCIPDGAGFAFIFYDEGVWLLNVWKCFDMFASSGRGTVSHPDLRQLLSLARQYKFVLETMK